MKQFEGSITTVEPLLDIEVNSRYREVIDIRAFQAASKPSLLKIETALTEMILAADNSYNASGIFVVPENLAALARLSEQFFYFNRDCQVVSYSHRFDVEGVVSEGHWLVPVQPQYVARPARFDFKVMNPASDPTVEPVLVSEMFAFSYEDEDGDDIFEVVDLLTPLRDCDIVLHTPTLN